MKTSYTFTLLVLFSVQVSLAQETVYCPSEEVCTEDNISKMNKTAKGIEYSIRYGQQEKAFENKENLDSKINKWISLNNKIQSCQKLQGVGKLSKIPACKLSIKSKKKISNSLTITSNSREFRTLNGVCQEVKPIDYKEIRNENGKMIAYSLKGRWRIPNNPLCETQNGELTSRSIQFGGLSEKYRRKAYIFVLDLADNDTYYNSTFRARRLNLGRSKMALVPEEDSLTFKWDNGAEIEIDSISGKIVNSNILSKASYEDSTCRTKKYYTRSGKPRMIPQIKLTSKFKHLRIRSPLNK
tara:strand:- start:592 stop:1485 length:894 start_codon:yes stop_codon:yes gene_type:complete